MKTILLITTVLVLFNINTVSAQDEVISKSLDGLRQKLIDNSQKLKSAQTDLSKISQSLSTGSIEQFVTDQTLGAIYLARIVHEYLPSMLLMKQYINKKKLMDYYKEIYENLLNSSKLLTDSCLGRINISYSYFKRQSSLYTADKAREILIESINEIDSAREVLIKENGLDTEKISSSQ